MPRGKPTSHSKDEYMSAHDARSPGLVLSSTCPTTGLTLEYDISHVMESARDAAGGFYSATQSSTPQHTKIIITQCGNEKCACALRVYLYRDENCVWSSIVEMDSPDGN